MEHKWTPFEFKLKSKSIRKHTHSPLRNVPSAASSSTSAALPPAVEHMVLENRKLVSNRSSTSNLEATEQHQTEHENEYDSAKSSKRASLAELDGLRHYAHAESTPMTRPDSLVATSHDLDAFVEVRA